MKAVSSVRLGYLLIAIVVGMLTNGCAGNRNASRGDLRVGVVYIGPHELIDQIVHGFRDELPGRLPGRQVEILERHANGDKSQLSATVNSAIAERLDLLVTVTTPVSVIAQRSMPSDLPLVFVGVTDPVEAGLVESLERPGRCTGVSDMAPLAGMLNVLQELTPSVESIAMVYSPDEVPAIYSRDKLQSLTAELGLNLDARPVANRDDLGVIVREALRSNDALVIGADNGMFEASPQLAKLALEAGKPFYSADSTSVKHGALAAVTVDYNLVGREGARIAARVLLGEAPGEIPVSVMTEGVLELNRTTLNTLELHAPPELLTKAREIYE